MEAKKEGSVRGTGFILLIIPFLIIATAIILRPMHRILFAQPTSSSSANITTGSPEKGRQAIVNYSCAACHQVPGISQATGFVGPPLDHYSKRSYIAGKFANTTDNLVKFIMHPQEVDPGIAMPDLGIDQQSAEDIAAYLYQLK